MYVTNARFDYGNIKEKNISKVFSKILLISVEIIEKIIKTNYYIVTGVLYR